MTKKFIRQCCKETKLYMTPHLNDVLYLHFKGFTKIEALEEYTGLKCLWLENNGIDRIENLESQTELRCLFLHNNVITRIENLEALRHLDTLNLCNNFVSRLENLSVLPALNTLSISHNRLQSVDDISELANCASLSVVDLSHNRLGDQLILQVFSAMPSLRVLTLTGNPVLTNWAYHRKKLIVACKSLTYLNEAPVFDKDRRCADAWKDGGLEAEREMRATIEKEEHQRMQDSINALLRKRDELRRKRMEEAGETLVLEEPADAESNSCSDSEDSARSDSGAEDEDCSGPGLRMPWHEARVPARRNHPLVEELQPCEPPAKSTAPTGADSKDGGMMFETNGSEEERDDDGTRGDSVAHESASADEKATSDPARREAVSLRSYLEFVETSSADVFPSPGDGGGSGNTGSVRDGRNEDPDRDLREETGGHEGERRESNAAVDASNTELGAELSCTCATEGSVPAEDQEPITRSNLVGGDGEVDDPTTPELESEEDERYLSTWGLKKLFELAGEREIDEESTRDESIHDLSDGSQVETAGSKGDERRPSTWGLEQLFELAGEREIDEESTRDESIHDLSDSSQVETVGSKGDERRPSTWGLKQFFELTGERKIGEESTRYESIHDINDSSQVEIEGSEGAGTGSMKSRAGNLGSDPENPPLEDVFERPSGERQELSSGDHGGSVVEDERRFCSGDHEEVTKLKNCELDPVAPLGKTDDPFGNKLSNSDAATKSEERDSGGDREATDLLDSTKKETVMDPASSEAAATTGGDSAVGNKSAGRDLTRARQEIPPEQISPADPEPEIVPDSENATRYITTSLQMQLVNSEYLEE